MTRGDGDRCRGEALGKNSLIVLEEGGCDWYWANVHVFELEPTFREVVRWETCPYPRLQDLDDDGRLDLSCADMAVELDSWRLHPDVLFRLTDRGFEPAPDLMRARDAWPSGEETLLLAREQGRLGKLWRGGRKPPRVRLRRALILMIYAGQADQARTLLAKFGPPPPERAAYWNRLVDDLRCSPYWELIQEVNQHRPFIF